MSHAEAKPKQPHRAQANRIRDLLKAAKIDARELPALTGKEQGTLRHVLSGRDRGSESLIRRLAELTGTSLDYIRGTASPALMELFESVCRAASYLSETQRKTLAELSAEEWAAMIDWWDAERARRGRNRP